MCSNTSSTSGAGVSGGGDDATHILKKPKRQRIPKRGPGVAELEKILREQETSNVINIPDHRLDKPGNNVPFASDHLHLHHNNVISHFSPPPPPPPLPPPSSMRMLFGNSGSKNTFSGSSTCKIDGIRIGGSSAMTLPEEALLPTVWNSCEARASIYEEAPKMPAGYPFSASFVNDSDHQIHFLHQNHTHQYPSPTINFFQQFGSSTSPDHNRAAAAVYVHHIEPPSSQSSSASCHSYSSILPVDQQMVGTKRPRIFSTENTTAGSAPPVFHRQLAAAASPSPFAHTHMHTLDHSSPFTNHSSGSTGFNVPHYRHEKLSRGDCGAMNGSVHRFGSPVTPSSIMTHQICQQDHFPGYHSIPFQVKVKGCSIDGTLLSKPKSHEKKRPFHSFLIPEEEQSRDDETALSLSNERPTRDTSSSSIDLNLKL